MNMLSKTLIISAALLAPLLVSGCTSTKSQTIVEAEFLKIAEDSCKRAQKHDILEKLTNDAPSRVLVLAKKHAYKNYSAIWIDNKNVPTVIYEYELSVCGPSYLVSMQKEANHDNSGDYEHSIKPLQRHG
jgi:outer membrane murein-binding lipoprotein Lpp